VILDQALEDDLGVAAFGNFGLDEASVRFAFRKRCAT
jgi:hypothetical protein